MSLPPTKKDISAHPARGSVVDPVNKKAKDADVERKMKFFGVIQAFRLGRLPTNKQINSALDYVLEEEHSPVATEKLSPDGKKLIKDIQAIIKTLKVMVHDKNGDELLQQFLWHTRDVEIGDKEKEKIPAMKEATMKEGSGAGASLSGAAAGPQDDDQQQAIRHLRTLLSLVLTNSEVRKLLSDFSIIGRDVLSNTLQKAASKIGPTKDELSRVDEPAAPSGQFISDRDREGRPGGPNETPLNRMEGGGIPGTDVRTSEGGGVQGQDRERGRQMGFGEVRETVEEGKGQLKEGAMRAVGGHDQPDVDDTGRVEGTSRGLAGDEKLDTAREHLEGMTQEGRGAILPQDEREAEESKKGFRERMKGYKESFADRVPSEHKERIEKGKKFLAEEYFPPERRDQFIYRGKKVIIECQKNGDYQEAIRWLLAYVGANAAMGQQKMKGREEEARGAFTGNQALQRSISEIRTLLERFANNESMEPIIDAFYALGDDAHRDKELKDWFEEVNEYFHQVLLEPGYVLDQQCNDRAVQLREGGRKFYDGKYKGHFDRLFGNIGSWFQAMGEDPVNIRFGENWANLTRDLLFDSEGGLMFKKDLWNDVRHVIIPQIIDKVGYIPIPRIEYTDETLDLVVENLTLSGRNLFPNIISLEAHNFLKFSPYASIKDESRHKFTLTFAQMQADMRDVAFYYRKKSGMPKIKDSGLADVVVGGEGVTATAVLVSAGADRSSVFKVQSVHVKVDSLKFSIRDSKHDLLYKTLKPLATGLVKRQIQKALQDAIQTGLEYVDGQLVGVRDRMESRKMEKEGGTDGERKEVLKEMMKKKEETTSISSSGASQSQFKVVADRRQSILSTQGHPAGWINRTQEKSEMASKGEEWRSDAFTITA